MRGEASPSNCAGQAELIEPLGIVVSDTPGEHLALPCVGGNFESLELAEDFKRGTFALQLRSRRDMLPAQEPAQELSGRDRLDLLAKRGDREAMNAGEQATVAPLVFVWRGRPGPRFGAGEISAKYRTAGFETQHGFLDLARSDAEQSAELG